MKDIFEKEIFFFPVAVPKGNQHIGLITLQVAYLKFFAYRHLKDWWNGTNSD